MLFAIISVLIVIYPLKSIPFLGNAAQSHETPVLNYRLPSTIPDSTHYQQPRWYHGKPIGRPVSCLSCGRNGDTVVYTAFLGYSLLEFLCDFSGWSYWFANSIHVSRTWPIMICMQGLKPLFCGLKSLPSVQQQVVYNFAGIFYSVFCIDSCCGSAG